MNGYQTVCEGCFAPFPYAHPTDPRFGAVTQPSTQTGFGALTYTTSAFQCSVCEVQDRREREGLRNSRRGSYLMGGAKREARIQRAPMQAKLLNQAV